MGVQVGVHHHLWHFVRDINSYYLLLEEAEKGWRGKERVNLMLRRGIFRKSTVGESLEAVVASVAMTAKTVWLICCTGNGGFFVFWFGSTCPR